MKTRHVQKYGYRLYERLFVFKIGRKWTKYQCGAQNYASSTNTGQQPRQQKVAVHFGTFRKLYHRKIYFFFTHQVNDHWGKISVLFVSTLLNYFVKYCKCPYFFSKRDRNVFENSILANDELDEL